jgi:hypothetical protein
MKRRGDDQRRDDVVGTRGLNQNVANTLISTEIAVTFAPRACALEAFRSPFIALDPAYCLLVSGHDFEGFSMGFSLLQDQGQ